MAVYYKFKSARDYDSIQLDGPFISVGTLKDKIFESKHLGSGKDFDLVVTNAQTSEEYLDEAMLIPKNTSVLIRRVPGRPHLPIVADPEPKKPEDTQPVKNEYSMTDLSAMNPEDVEWDEFGTDLYSIPEAFPAHSSNPVSTAPATTNNDEDSKIRALIETPALNWQLQGSDGAGAGRGFGRGLSGRMGGRGVLGRIGMDHKTPPPGYICHRCQIPGHLIQHCPTNGDPSYDIKRVKPPTGIPKSMLIATPDGSYALPSGAAAVLKPNEAAFEKAIEGLPSTRSIGDLPPELHCPLCKAVMKDAVLTSRCCFKSFCDMCIRDYIISKSACVCGATDVLADDLLPNKTLRDTINRILEAGTNSVDNVGSTLQVQDMESARNLPRKLPSPCTSAASKEQKPVEELKHEAKESLNVLEATEEVQQKLNPDEHGKKKKKKARAAALNLQWNGDSQALAADYIMPIAPAAFNPYWSGDGFMGPYPGPMPYMGYGPGPFGGVMPLGPFGPRGIMYPPVPPRRNMPPPVMSREEFEARKAELRRKREIERQNQRDRSGEKEPSRDDDGPSMATRSKNKTVILDHGRGRSERERSSDERAGREPEPPRRSSKRKSEQSQDRYDSSPHHHHHNHRHHHHYHDPKRRSKSRDRRDRDRHHRQRHHNHRGEPSLSSSSSKHEQTSENAAEGDDEGSVFRRISVREGESKRRVSTSSSSSRSQKQRGKKERGAGADEYEWSEEEEDDRHFKRRPSRYRPSPSPPPPLPLAP